MVERDAITAYGARDYNDAIGEKRVAFISGYCAHAMRQKLTAAKPIDISTHRGNLYAFCDAEQTDPCDTLHLMVKDMCAGTIRELTDRSARFTCAPVNAATRDAYLRTLDPDDLANTFRAWREGR